MNGLLWDIYKAIIDKEKEEGKNYLTIAGIIFVKVILPFIFIFWQKKYPLQFFPFAIISGFYVYLIFIMYSIFNNEDLKRRIKINNALNQIINFDANIDEEENDEQVMRQSKIKKLNFN
jgi:hypothetical protein